MYVLCVRWQPYTRLARVLRTRSMLLYILFFKGGMARGMARLAPRWGPPAWDTLRECRFVRFASFLPPVQTVLGDR